MGPKDAMNGSCLILCILVAIGVAVEFAGKLDFGGSCCVFVVILLILITIASSNRILR